MKLFARKAVTIIAVCVMLLSTSIMATASSGCSPAISDVAVRRFTYQYAIERHFILSHIDFSFVKHTQGR